MADRKVFLDDLAGTIQNPTEAAVHLIHQSPSREAQESNGVKRTTTRWVSFIEDDLEIQSSANYSSPWEDLGNSAAQTAEQAATAVAQTGLIPSSWIENVSIRNFAQSILHWQSSDRPSFNLRMHFVTWRTNPPQRVMLRASELASMPQPGVKEVTNGVTVMSRPAGYYGINQRDGAGQTIVGGFTMAIGTWFRVRNLVFRDASMTISKEQTTAGEPLYVTVNCSLEPFKAVSWNEFLSWFLKAR